MYSVNRAEIANIPDALMDHAFFLEVTFNLGIARQKLKYPQLFGGTGAARGAIFDPLGH